MEQLPNTLQHSQKTTHRSNSESKGPCLQSSVPLSRSAQTSGMTDRERQQASSPERGNAFIRTDLKTTASSSSPSPFHPSLSSSFPWQHTLSLSLTWLLRPPCVSLFLPTSLCIARVFHLVFFSFHSFSSSMLTCIPCHFLPPPILSRCFSGFLLSSSCCPLTLNQLLLFYYFIGLHELY